MYFETGLSGLRASQFALGVVSHNLANANTPGYHRQSVTSQTRYPHKFDRQFIGSGVDIRSVDRVRSQIIESSLTNSVSDLSNIDQQLGLERGIEHLFSPGLGSLQDSISNFFDELSALSANPSELVQRNAVIQEGVGLAERLQLMSDEMAETERSVERLIDLEVADLNRQLETLVELQREIRVAENSHAVPNDLLDRRDQLVNLIAEKIDIQRNENSHFGLGLTISGQSINIGSVPIRFEAIQNEAGDIEFRIEDTDREINFRSGRLDALQNFHNDTLETYVGDLDQLASNIIRSVDQAHAGGVGTSGSFSQLTGSRSVQDVDVPLNEAGVVFPIENGELTLSVIDDDGNRRNYSVPIDPATDSLRDVIDRIDDIPGVRATISSQTNKVNISSNLGFRFDFTGAVESSPDLALYSGTSAPQLSGRYIGEENETFRVEIPDNGIVGVTDGLQAIVYNEAGDVVGELNIGAGYEAGTELKLAEGVSVQFGRGEVVSGDSFETRLIADSDSSGFLSATGVNSFFTGAIAADIAVNQDIIDDPTRLATSKSGELGDTFNLVEIVSIRDELTSDDGELTFEDFLGEVVAKIGYQVQASQNVQQGVSTAQFNLQSERDAISGVDVNEELLNLTKYQKAYEASVQVIRTMEAMLDELYQIIR